MFFKQFNFVSGRGDIAGGRLGDGCSLIKHKVQQQNKKRKMIF